MWIKWNPNPTGRAVGDCVVRAASKALDVDWETAYLMLSKDAFYMGDMPSSDSVLAALLRQGGYYRTAIPNDCPDCYTVADFARDHPKGKFVLALGGHVVALENGDWYDTWNSGNECPQYYWYRKDE